MPVLTFTICIGKSFLPVMNPVLTTQSPELGRMSITDANTCVQI